ncbi:DUF397 domain-containing protein [Streptomyces sp. NPDC020742]|uniref:DUF397 domain-containing protein n=1 Tax=unclassified Streptomyces TaxID=2593676 RepID=UPI0033F98273
MTERPPSRAEISATAWIKSSYSAANNECVEIARTAAGVAVRDSKDPHGPVLLFPATAFASFVDDVRHGG